LLNTDTRWEFICQSVDDRNEQERRPGGIAKSRYGPISLFISEDKRNFKRYNDEKKTLNKWAWRYINKKAKELDVKVDRKLLDHFSYLFVRDNLCVFEGTLTHEPNMNETKLFEAIQSSNWNDVRFKPPPSLESSIGWRVEFRSPDVQLTPELTFLFSHSIQVLSRLLIKMHDEINFYIPMSKVTENFRRANLINAAVEQKFFFRTNLFEAGHPQIEELTIAEIFHGKVEPTHLGIFRGFAEGSGHLFDSVNR
jgi:glutamate--cysteine ligase catalytic subunit